jgi:molybdopterin molybdotransferase
MKEFFKVVPLNDLLSLRTEFNPLDTERVPLEESLERILAQEIVSDVDIPGFSRSTMDGYAVKAASTFGASESSPAFLNIIGAVVMGDEPQFSITLGQAAKIATGGMLPKGADSVAMVEHTDAVTDTTIEVFKSVAPGQNIITRGEDIKRKRRVLTLGHKIRPQELGLLAAMGQQSVTVYKRPVVGIISTGDELVSIDRTPASGQIRDINTYTLLGLVSQAGGIPKLFGLVKDRTTDLKERCAFALATSDMVLISGGSSVGVRDLSIDVIAALPQSRILVHGISISPGKPTILAKSGNKPLWGLPGHAVSAMVVFLVGVRPFLRHLSGVPPGDTLGTYMTTARLTRNLASVQGRMDCVRVRVMEKGGQRWAEPVLGKSGLIHTMVEADGLIFIDLNQEGLVKGAMVHVYPI